jgi:hypothetical protein
MRPQAKDGHFFTTRKINNDLMKLQQGQIDNNDSGHRKMMSSFIRTDKQDTHGHAKIQLIIMHR